jgi:DNA-binding MarR family transcriptional regulator
MTNAVDSSRLATVISPLRRALLTATRNAAGLPEIPDSQIEVLRALPRGTVSTSGALALGLGLSKSTMSNLLTAMEADGLVVRRTSLDDRRRVDVLASPRALALFDRFDEESARILASALDRLPSESRTALAAALPALEQLTAALTNRWEPSNEGAS